MRRPKTALALTAVAIATTTGVASAHTVSFDSQVTARFTEQPGPPDISSDSGWDYFSGRVTSPRPKCKANRVVRVYRKQPGDDPFQGSKTDADGFWRLNSEDPPNGTYYAKAARKVLANTTAHTHVCSRARSPYVVVDDPSPTRITLVDVDLETIHGQLSSPFEACVRDRTVRATVPGTGTAFYTTRSDLNGGFTIGVGDIPWGTPSFRVKVAQKSVDSRLCERDTADVTVDDATLSGGASFGAFRGVLNSSVDACEPGRTISLYEMSADPEWAGWNITDGSGAWTIDGADGNWEARADPAMVGGGDAFTYCRPLVSPRWSYEEPPEE